MSSAPPRPPGPGAGAPGDLRDALLLTLLGVLFRVGYLVTPYIDSDQAVFGLQALHVLKGEFPAFSWGYPYIGTLQTLLDALLFSLFGASRVVLNGAVLLFYVGYSLSLYSLSAAFFPARRWRVLATALGAVAPGYFVFHGVWARHGYPETFFFGTLLLALICRHLEREERPRFYAGLFLVAGLAWWSNFLILYYFLPLGLYLAYQLFLGLSFRSRARIVAASTAGFLAGSLPFWVHNLRNDFDSLVMFHRSPAAAAEPAAVPGMIWNTFTVLVGAREQREDYTVPGLGPLLALLCAAAILFFVGSRALQLAKIPARRRLVPEDILLAFGLSVLFVFAGSGQSPRGLRYLIPFYSFYPLCLVYALASLERRGAKRWLLAGLVCFLLAMNTASALARNPLLDKPGREQFRESMAIEEGLFDDMAAAGRRQALTHDYWTAYRLTFDARERVVIDHVDSRYPEYLCDIFAGGKLSYLFEHKSEAFERGARLLGFSFSERPLRSALLYTDFRPAFGAAAAVPPERYRLRGAEASAPVAALSDRVLSTSSPLGQGGGAVPLDAEFEMPTAVAGLALFLENAYDAPTHVRVTDLESGRVLADGAGADYGYRLGAGPFLPTAPPFLEVFFSATTTRRVRVSFPGVPRPPGFFASELVFFAALERGGEGDEALFERIGRERHGGAVFCGPAAVRPLEQALGRKLAYRRERPVSFQEDNLFVFEREYLRHNLGVVDDLGLAREFGEGSTFAFIRTRGRSWAEGRWLEKALFRALDPEQAAADYRAAARRAAADPAGAEALLRRALARYPDHYGSLLLLEELLRNGGGAGELQELRSRRDRLARAERGPEAAFGSKIELAGLALGGKELRPGEQFTITYNLSIREKVRGDHWVFVHFLSPGGKILFQIDRPLAGHGRAFLYPGEIVEHEAVVTVPRGLDAHGPVGIFFGIARPDSGKKLKARTGLERRGDRVRIGEFLIRP